MIFLAVHLTGLFCLVWFLWFTEEFSIKYLPDDWKEVLAMLCVGIFWPAFVVYATFRKIFCGD